MDNNYMLDLDAIMDFVFADSDKSTNTEITESYEGANNDLSLRSKTLREVQNGDNTNVMTIRYDFIKVLLDNVFNYYPIEDELTGEDEFKVNIVMNTLLNNGMLKEIK